MKLPNDKNSQQSINKIETDVYQAVLDKILDDGFIEDDEAVTIAAAEKTLRISPTARLQVKKEIFSAAYIEAIHDREITPEEIDKLRNLITGLAIPQAEVRRELNIVQEIIDTQALCLPFKPVSPDELSVSTQKNENVFYQCVAQVLSKRKSKESPTG